MELTEKEREALYHLLIDTEYIDIDFKDNGLGYFSFLGKHFEFLWDEGWGIDKESIEEGYE